MAESSADSEDKSSRKTTPDIGDKKPPPPEDNSELNDLLDSALDDFDKPSATPAKEQPSKSQKKKDQDRGDTSDENKDNIPPNQEALFNELFNSGGGTGATADFQNALGDLMSELGKEFTQDQQFNEELSKLMQMTVPPGAMPEPSASFPSASTVPLGGDGGSSNTSAGTSGLNTEDDITRTLGDTLNRLSQNAQELQQETGGMPDDFMRAFQGMNMGDENAELLPMMQSVMQNLLCKEVLYPSLKEVVGKYPQWLTEKKESLAQSDYDRYCKQLDIMQRLCIEYEAETDSDSANQKQQRTMRVMDLIQQMESLGQPPKDIVGDMGPGFLFDEEGNPRMPGMMAGMMPGMPPGDQCSIM